MKTLNLLGLLSHEEKNILSERLKTRKRNSLQKLYKAFLKLADTKPGKGLLFKSAFAENYEPSKDYLLRNELRLLNKEIENLISESDGKNKAEPLAEILMLERMLCIGKVDGFLNLFNEMERNAKEKYDFKLLVKLYDLVIDFYVRYQEVSLGNYETVIGYLSLKDEALTEYEAEARCEMKLQRNFSLRVIQSLDQEKFYKLKNIDTKKAPKSVISEYLDQYAETYFYEGSRKIESYKELIKQLPKVAKLRPEREKDLSTLYGSLALTLFLGHEHQEADKYYTIAIKNAGAEPYLDLLFNYCVNALLIGKYKEVVGIYGKHFNGIDSNDKLKYRFRYFTAIAYLMNEKPDAAFKMLDHEITQRPVTEYYYYRVVYAMVYFQKKDYENAERELDNILQSFRFRKTAKQEDKPLVKLMQRLLTLESYQSQKSKYRSEVHKISQDIEIANKEDSGFSSVIYMWLVWQVNKRLG